ncbi:hypothetical protein Cpin_3569 [Chitinophaga pinensis DSM 2588]|uniref:Uncharacterized protein n=1 Tax=Chitinophaga pinensis (strain ATCC 43595 / DSM 2588 / LMG 13176 / NBRC 15968 / NCIMB 11800 / UQM 2034) TaxID=485918 RepID=A0A979G594_CHIPD|nr:hypothetical protein Cpin_3569 [Chitinophaga pinensis DSM 2588]
MLAIVCFAYLSSVHAQRIIHGVGTGVFVDGSSKTETKASSVLNYSVRVSFAETDNTSLSLGIPFSAGINGVDEYYYDSYTGEYGYNNLGFMVNVPLMFNFNIGAGSAEGCQNRMGFFIGGGFAYHISSVDRKIPELYYDYIAYDDLHTTASTIGPAANIGLRIGIGARKRHNIEINTFYMKGVTSYKPHIGGLTCLFNF